MSNTNDSTSEKHGIVLSARTYDLLKDLNLIALPGLATAAGTALTLYGVDAQATAMVVGTIAIVATVLGIFLKIVSVQYNADAKVAAVATASTIAAIPDPVITVSATDPSKLEVVSAGRIAESDQVQVFGGSQ